MPHAFETFDLASIYAEAERLTRAAIDALRGCDGEQAYRLLEERVALVRRIQRHAAGPVAWGSDERAEAAALSYLRADGELGAQLDAMEA